MSITTRFKNAWRGLQQRWGSTRAKRKLWNSEFETGRWQAIDHTPGDMVYPYVEKYARGGEILDLGCGSGNTGCELAVSSYSKYVGIDIADVAVQKALQRSQECGRGEKNHYRQSDIADYLPDQKFDVILFRESIYYIPRLRIKSVLERYSHSLKPGGVIIIRWHEGSLAEDLLKLVHTSFDVVERSQDTGGPVVLVFRLHGT